MNCTFRAALSCFEISLKIYSERKNLSRRSRNVITFSSHSIMNCDFQLRGCLSRFCLKSSSERFVFRERNRAGDGNKLWLPECIRWWAAKLVWAARSLVLEYFQHALVNKLVSQKTKQWSRQIQSFRTHLRMDSNVPLQHITVYFHVKIDRIFWTATPRFSRFQFPRNRLAFTCTVQLKLLQFVSG